MQNRVWSGQTDQTEQKAGASGFEPISAIEAKPQSDHNSLTNKPQLAAVQNQPPTASAAKPHPDDTETHNFYANSMPMSGYVALSHVVASWPTLSNDDQQRILAIARGTDGPQLGEENQIPMEPNSGLGG